MAHLELPGSPLIGYEDITLTNTVKMLNEENFSYSGTGSTPTVAFIQVQKNTVRCRFDGGNPTGNSGIMLVAGDAIKVEGVDALAQAKFISDTNQAVTLSVTYFA